MRCFSRKITRRPPSLLTNATANVILSLPPSGAQMPTGPKTPPVSPAPTPAVLPTSSSSTPPTQLTPARGHLQRKVRMIAGWLLASFGFLFASNFLISGPRAFGLGMHAVVVGSICSGVGCAMGIWVLWKEYHNRPRKEGICPACDYDLRGLTSPRCPECGHPVALAPELPTEQRAKAEDNQ